VEKRFVRPGGGHLAPGRRQGADRRGTRRRAAAVAIIGLALLLVAAFWVLGEAPAATGDGPSVGTLTSTTHPLEGRWYADDSPAFSWSAAAAADIAGYSFAIDQAPDAVPDLVSEGLATSAAYAGLADGVWYFHVRAEDSLGRWGPAATTGVRIDTRPPRFTWEGVSPCVLYRADPVRLRFSVADRSGTIRVAYQVYDAWGIRVARRGGFVFAPSLRSLSVRTRYADGQAFAPGLYRVRLRLVDAAGNVRTTRYASFRQYRPVQARVWFDVPGAGRRVALTFDDGYDTAAWNSIVSTLRAYRARGTFFVNGCYVAAHPDLARRTVAEGNAIGSHAWRHASTVSQTRQEIRDALTGDLAVWWRVARVTPAPYFRPPYGSWDDDTLAVAGSLGFARVVMWDVDPSRCAGSAAVADNVLSHAHSGAIVIMHCTPASAGALPAIIGGLRARGYTLATLPALFRAAGYR
jgi:peptidoglycan/xylan/chitin deacetylase (PgdA/CDA1 family)